MKTRKRHHKRRLTRKRVGGMPPKSKSSQQSRKAKSGFNSNKAAQKRRNRSHKLIKKRRQEAFAQKRKALKNTLEILKVESNITNSDVKNSYEQCIEFIKLFIEKADYVRNSGNAEKEDNYAIFAMALMENLKAVNNNFDDILNSDNIDDEGNPLDYLEEYIELVEDKKIVKNFDKVVEEHYKNSENDDDYLELYNFLNDSVNAVKETIKTYSLKKMKKISNNMQVDNEYIKNAQVDNEYIKKNEQVNNAQLNSIISKFSSMGFNNNDEMDKLLGRLLKLDL